MNDREILRQLRRKKFAVLVQWKQELEIKFPLHVDEKARLPPRLLFRSFDEVVCRLKRGEYDTRRSRIFALAGDLTSGSLPPIDRYLEVFLTGEQVLGDFVVDAAERGPDSCCDVLLAFQNALYEVFHEIIRREIAVYRAAASAGAGAAVRGANRAFV